MRCLLRSPVDSDSFTGGRNEIRRLLGLLRRRVDVALCSTRATTARPFTSCSIVMDAHTRLCASLPPRTTASAVVALGIAKK